MVLNASLRDVAFAHKRRASSNGHVELISCLWSTLLVQKVQHKTASIANFCKLQLRFPYEIVW